MAAPISVAYLIRTWRENVGLTQNAVASTLRVGASTLSQWESGRRKVDAETVADIDRLVGADHALSDLAFAVGTPTGLPCLSRWAHNFAREDRAVWAWLRCPTDVIDESVKAGIIWGPWRGVVDVPSGDGLVVTSPVSVPNPAALVQLGSPGWVDFGRGAPPWWLPVPIVDATKIVAPDDDTDFVLGLVSDKLAARLKENGRTAADLATFLDLPSAAIEAVVGSGGGRQAGGVTIPKRPAVVGRSRADSKGDLLRAVRVARNLSLRDVVRIAASLPGISDLDEPISLHAIRQLEKGQYPRVPEIVPRLDVVYGCDGLLTHHYIFRERQGRLLRERFPPYWVGPVWLEVVPTENQAGHIEIRWNGHRRPVELHGPTFVTFRQAWAGMPPVEIACIDSCIVSGGLGREDEAVDINAQWIPDGYREPIVVDEVFAAVLGMGHKTLEDFDQFLSGPKL